MAIELKFSKPDINTSWGFRLAGGAECDVPLTVVKVIEGSIAENVGLQVNDVVVNVNNYNIEKLTHAEAHDVILNAGQEFILQIYRGNIFDDVQNDEENNQEVSNIMEGSPQRTAVESFIEEKSAVVVEEGRLKREITDEQIAEAISGETELLPEQNILGVNFNKVDLEGSKVLKAISEETTEAKIDLQNKKWSTFLRKPERPVVKPKQQEAEGPNYPPYKVVIKKQSKKNAEIKEELARTFELVESHESAEESEVTDRNEEIDEYENLVEEEFNQQDEEASEELFEPKKTDDEKSFSSTEELPEQQDQKLTETTTTVPSLTLEEQLAQVQQQLQALAQLPSAIQVTLDAVTQQLTKIVKATHKKNEELQETIAEQTITSEDETLEEITEELPEKFQETTDMSDVEAEMKLEEAESLDTSERYEEELNQNPEEEDNDEHGAELQIEEDIQVQTIDDEKVAQQERIDEFHQRRLEQRPTHPLAPLQRPIILPGGRRWSQPDDALPVTRKPKMTDEKINETLETYAEIITGKTKGLTTGMLFGRGAIQKNQSTACIINYRGLKSIHNLRWKLIINFLKYQPPPINLGYLQNSEVFKMVHDMDPPRRGIAARSGKIASEQDYYSQNPHHGSRQTAVEM